MHISAKEYGKAFFQNYVTKIDKPIIVEIGSQDVNGSLRSYTPQDSSYIGLDFTPGKSVDIVLTDEYKFPFPDNYADFVVTSSCFEHSQFFWLSFLEAMRILKPSGVIYINAPSKGTYHRYPTDNWRFYPDSGKALAKYAQREGHDSKLLESFTIVNKEPWHDTIMIILKDKEYIDYFPTRIHNIIVDDIETTNIWSDKNENCLCNHYDMNKPYIFSNQPLDCSISGQNLEICDN